MIDRSSEGRGVRGILDSLGHLFRHASEAPRPIPVNRSFADVELEFEQALAALRKRIETRRPAVRGPGPHATTAQELAQERQRRKADAHRRMRADIEGMHVVLRTGLTGADLDDGVAFLLGLHAASREGRDAHALIFRARHAIAQRLRAEAGAMALDRVLAKLRRKHLRWPDPRPSHPRESHEEIEAARRRRMGDVRAAFVAYGLERIAERARGVVWGWGGDYPDRGSPLWRESVLVGVAAGIWARLLQHFVGLLRQDEDLLLSRASESPGQKLPALHAVLDDGSAPVWEAREAVASSLQLLDETIPQIAWQLVQARLPRARPGFALEASDVDTPDLPARTAAERP